MEETESFQNYVHAFSYFSGLNEFFVRGGRLRQDFPNQQYHILASASCHSTPDSCSRCMILVCVHVVHIVQVFAPAHVLLTSRVPGVLIVKRGRWKHDFAA